MTAPRAAAVAALLTGAVALALAVVVGVQAFPNGLIVVALLAVASIAAWYAIVGPLPLRIAGGAIALACLGASLWLMISRGIFEELALIGIAAISSACTRRAFDARVDLERVSPPGRPVLFFNPRSGGGKAERFNLAEEARRRGFGVVAMEPGEDLEALVRGAVAEGADALAMAGGDGSQAVVAAIAAEHDLPYACIPAGTRNHFACDLGVDRDDVVGALDAFVDGNERRVDLAEVNGRVFVNNVSLGLYASAVQRSGYRDAKVRTLLETVPEMVGPQGTGLDLTWSGPGGHEHHSGVAILVSNNRYRLGRAVGSGTRPRIDDGLLGIAVFGAPRGRGGNRRLQRPWRDWSASDFEVGAGHPVPAGIDGEAATLDAPLRFRIRPGVLRVRVSRRHPGASPSAELPDGFREGALGLLRIALGRRDAAAPSRARAPQRRKAEPEIVQRRTKPPE
ncbi:MAG: diacylglycerol kinase [Solirubrobacterales bacterium]|nr:diacylglycerol kinase [Solirubrobacterales bacterium]